MDNQNIQPEAEAVGTSSQGSEGAARSNYRYTISAPEPQRGEFWLYRERVKGWEGVGHVLENSSVPYTQGEHGEPPGDSLIEKGARPTAFVWAFTDDEFIRPATLQEAEAWIAKFGRPEPCILPTLAAPAAPEPASGEGSKDELIRDLVAALKAAQNDLETGFFSAETARAMAAALARAERSA